MFSKLKNKNSDLQEKYNEHFKKSKNKFLEQIQLLVKNGFYKNQKIKDIVILDDEFLKRDLSKYNGSLLFASFGCYVPFSIKVITNNNEVVINAFIDKDMSVIKSKEPNDAVKYMSELLGVDRYVYPDDLILKSIIKKFQLSIRDSNKFKEKESCERAISDFLLDKSDLNKYRLAKLSLAVFLKEFFFKELGHRNNFSIVLNESYSYENYAQDYILYAHLRGKKINCGNEKITTEEIMHQCSYDNYTFNYYRCDDRVNDIFKLLKLINGIDEFLPIVVNEINKINDNEKLLPRDNLFKYAKELVKK